MGIKVLIIDDSALVRQTMTQVLESDSQIEVIGSAPDPIVGVRMIQASRPDVIISDIEMARMDGLTFLKKINETTTNYLLLKSTNEYEVSIETLPEEYLIGSSKFPYFSPVITLTFLVVIFPR